MDNLLALMLSVPLYHNAGMNIDAFLAEKIGLVVITLERYFKVTHAVHHRKYYRQWMTKVGVAVPWISGFCTFVIPASVSTRAVPGQCPMMGLWPTQHGEKVGCVNNYYLEHSYFLFC